MDDAEARDDGEQPDEPPHSSSRGNVVGQTLVLGMFVGAAVGMLVGSRRSGQQNRQR